MLTSFVLSLALAAPVPVGGAPAASGPAPKLLELKPAADGKVTVTVVRTEAQVVEVTQLGPNGVPVTAKREVQVPKFSVVELGNVKDLKVTTADGKKVEVADAVKKLKNGGVVAVSADGNPVAPNFLKALKDDVLVLASPELAGPTLTVPALPGVPPLPVPAAPAVPAPPAGAAPIPVQIQIPPAPGK